MVFCLGWFFLCLLPVLNIVPSGVYFAERYLFAGTLAFCLLIAYYLLKLPQSKIIFGKLDVKKIIMSFIIGVVIFDVMRIWTRNTELHDDVSLFESAVRSNPQSALMRTDLGITYTKYHEPQKAVSSLNEAIQMRPDDPVTYFSMAEAYIQLQQNEKAIESLQKAITLDGEYADAHYNLAGLYALSGFKKEAKDHLDKALFYYRKQQRIQNVEEFEQSFYDYFGNELQ